MRSIMPYKEFLSAIAIALTFVAFAPYIRSIVRGSTRPHVFSWIIWGATTFVVFLAQLAAKGGVGAWPIGVSGIITIGIAMLAYARRGDVTVTRLDWLFLGAAMSALPLWYFTSDPLWAVVVLTIVDLLGFGPTVRKAYYAPRSESVLFFSLFAARNVLVIFSLETYSMTTVLFPAVIAAACIAVGAILLFRRQVVVT